MFDVPPPVSLGLIGLFLMGTPVRNTIGLGQHGLYSLFFFVLALYLQQRNAPRVAAVCLALSWLKFTITWPLSIVFVAPAYRATLLAAAGIHVVLTLFVSFWTHTSSVGLLMGPLAVSETGTVIQMFDFVALFHYLGVSTRAPAFVLGAILFCFAAVVILRTHNDLLARLSWLTLVSLLWTHHTTIDYLALVVPLLYAIMKWREGAVRATDRLQIGLTLYGVLIIWFGMRMLDAVQARLPTDPIVDLAQRVTFWTAAVAIYAQLVCSANELMHRPVGAIEASVGSAEHPNLTRTVPPVGRHLRHYGRLMERTRCEQFPPSKTGISPAARGVLQLKHHVMFAQQRGLVPRSQCDKTRCAAVENLGTAVDDRCTTQTS